LATLPIFDHGQISHREVRADGTRVAKALGIVPIAKPEIEPI
jgi:hypothetical protein